MRFMNDKGRCCLKGFTLVEVIASLIIVSVSMLSVMRFYRLLNLNHLVRYHSVIGGNLLQRKMEEIISEKRTDFDETIVDTSGTAYIGYPDYIFEVREFPWKANPYLKMIEVKGIWPFPGGGTTEKTIRTVVFDRSP